MSRPHLRPHLRRRPSSRCARSRACDARGRQARTEMAGTCNAGAPSPREPVPFASVDRRGGEPALIAVATDRQTPAATADDSLALQRLAARWPVRVEAVPWDAPARWERYAAVLIRSTWDYHLRPAAFLEWAKRVEQSGAALWNPAAVVRWNADKRYLGELARAGVPVIPTETIARGTGGDLGRRLRQLGWEQAIVKPAVGASSYRTGRVDADDPAAGAALLGAVHEEADALVQPFLPEVCRDGEWSFIYFDGGDGALAFSHAVLKRPDPGDFRVQTEYGGTVDAVLPPPSLLRQADAAAATIARLAPGPLLYARIDGVVSAGTHAPEGTFLLMEAELIEPALFFAFDDAAADRFSAAVARRLALAPA